MRAVTEIYEGVSVPVRHLALSLAYELPRCTPYTVMSIILPCTSHASAIPSLTPHPMRSENLRCITSIIPLRWSLHQANALAPHNIHSAPSCKSVTSCPAATWSSWQKSQWVSYLLRSNCFTPRRSHFQEPSAPPPPSPLKFSRYILQAPPPPALIFVSRPYEFSIEFVKVHHTSFTSLRLLWWFVASCGGFHSLAWSL